MNQRTTSIRFSTTLVRVKVRLLRVNTNSYPPVLVRERTLVSALVRDYTSSYPLVPTRIGTVRVGTTVYELVSTRTQVQIR